MQNRGLLPQRPVTLDGIDFVKTAGHLPPVIHAVMRSERTLDHVIGMARDGKIPAGAGLGGNEVAGFAVA